MKLIENDVLNGEKTLFRLYRKLSVPDLVGRLRCCKVNLLLIGKDNSWLVNAKTSHKSHFVGTKLSVGLTDKAESTTRWTKLANLVLRHASPGATVKVYCLHPKHGRTRWVSEFKKCEGIPF